MGMERNTVRMMRRKLTAQEAQDSSSAQDLEKRMAMNVGTVSANIHVYLAQIRMCKFSS